MRKVLIFCSVIIFCFTSFYSCYYDIEQELYPDENMNCDTVSLSFQHDVLPIIKQNCYRCHSFAIYSVSGGGINLEGYTQLKLYADNSQLMNAVNHTGGVIPMPKDGAKLSYCDRAAINRWILNHAPDN